MVQSLELRALLLIWGEGSGRFVPAGAEVQPMEVGDRGPLRSEP